MDGLYKQLSAITYINTLMVMEPAMLPNSGGCYLVAICVPH